ncbi:MAG: hypothetical protein JSW52_08405 [Candidatus Coatesbacteria bacterium]|nr:MAG: hypothetical protein JSW52_08405 [Candidatus Coatesbacteria bacterium]
MRRIILATLSMILLTAGVAAAYDVGGDVNLTGSNEAYCLRQKEDGRYWAWDELQAELGIGQRFGIGVVAEFNQPKRDMFGDPDEYFNEITRKYFRYRDKVFEAYIGDYQKTVGRGLLFRSYDNEELDEDNIVEGALVDADVFDLGEITGFFGENRREGYDYDDRVRGFAADFRPIRYFSIMAGIVRCNMEDSLGNPVDTQLNGFGGGFYWDYADFYAEYADRAGWDVSVNRNRDGRGYYLNGNVYMPWRNLAVGIQYKDYDHLYYPYSSPPTVTHSGRSLNEGANEKGYMVSVSTSPFRRFKAEGGYAALESRPVTVADYRITREITEYYFLARYDFPKPELIVEGGFTYWDEYTFQRYEGSDPNLGDIEVGELRKWPTVKATYDFMEDFSVFGEFEYEIFTRYRTGPDEDTTYRRIDSGLSYRSLTGFTLRYEDSSRLERELWGDPLLDQYRDVDRWIWYEGYLNILGSHTLTVGYGGQRGGLVCSGGVCRQEAPFKGFRVTLTSSF